MPELPTPEVIAELRELQSAATPGPWRSDPWPDGKFAITAYGDSLIADVHEPIPGELGEDHLLIVALHNNADALLSAAEEAQRLTDLSKWNDDLNKENADLQQKLKFAQNELNLTRETRNEAQTRLRQIQAEESTGPVVEVLEHTRVTSPGCSQDADGSMEYGKEKSRG